MSRTFQSGDTFLTPYFSGFAKIFYHLFIVFIILDNCLFGFFFNWHSRILITVYPLFLKNLETSLSRNLFLSILFFQYFLFVFGILPFWHLQPCQKQPSTKTHNLHFGKNEIWIAKQLGFTSPSRYMV